MHPGRIICCFVLVTLSLGLALAQDNSTDSQSSRNGKIFSLFSVVQFKNSGCKSQSPMSSGQSSVRNGTCYTASECSSKGGSASGNCAAGFGVCCLFLVSQTGSVINQNCTYIRNPGFPSAYSGSGSISYTISKCSSDVCWLRLDFETFNILGPASTTEPATVCPDQFLVTTTTTPASLIPTICGSNAGQHVYVDMGNVATDTTTLSFTFTGTSTARTWEIKVSQVPCSNLGRPPQGCLQYYTTLTGRITSFNFKSTTSSHLINQDQTICVRQAQGYCCVQYELCADQANPFTLDRTWVAADVIKGLVDSSCIMDYVAIPASTSGQCNNRLSNQFSRYCGSQLGLTILGVQNQPVCDCTAPFIVNIHTDAINDGAATTILAPASRGLCLDYQQIPCNN